MEKRTTLHKNRIAVYAIAFSTHAGLLVWALWLLFVHAGELSGREATLYGMEMICIVISALLCFSVLRGGEVKGDAAIFLMLLTVGTVYLFVDAVFYIVEGDAGQQEMNMAANTIYLLCPVVMVVLFWRLLDIWVGKSRYYKWTNGILLGIAATEILLFLGNIPLGYFFYISGETGAYARGPLYPMTVILSTGMAIICVGRILYQRLPWRDRGFLLIYPLLPYLAIAYQVVFDGPAIVSIATFCSVAFIYTNFYVRREQRYAEINRELVETRLRALQMQINPHFLYNTLASVAGLCETKPLEAQEMIYHLSKYMRDNFTDIEKPSIIPFREEMNALDHYIAIERVRFPNITIEKDLPITDFQIPTMSLQPLVENAINHGIRKRKESGGIIRIETRETEKEYRIRVMDDGVGFREGTGNPSRKHFGLENVRTRLALLCGGELTIRPRIDGGEGTEVIITIPKKNGGV